jgi:hypothetical protein
MRNIFIAFLLLFLLMACSGSKAAPASDEAARVVEQYITALAEKNADRLSALSCADWESNALMELDSFQAVQTRVEGLQCRTTGTEGETFTVACQGKIVATYGNEDQAIDLSIRAYNVVRQGGAYLVCGYR